MEKMLHITVNKKPLKKMKPIFIIEFPKNIPQDMLSLIVENTNQNTLELKKDYHVLFSIGKEEVTTYKLFNSPYTLEEYNKLELLIKEIQENHVSKKN
jgi:hypothetical protein